MKRKTYFIISGLILLVLAAAGCAGGRGRREAEFYDNQRAKQLYARALQEVEVGEYTPAIVDVYHAERLCTDESLSGKIINLKVDIINHMQIYTSIGEGAVLKYTLLYQNDDVFYPVENMHVKFSFVEGDGVIAESANTNSVGTAEGKIEKISSIKRYVIVEAVPVIYVSNEIIRIEELMRQITFSRNKEGNWEVDLGNLEEFLKDSLDFLDEIFKDIVVE
jgi:hypothetical protein